MGNMYSAPVNQGNESHHEKSGNQPGLWIVGIGSQYPPYLRGPDDLEEHAARYYDIESPGIRQLLKINRTTGIEKRSAISPWEEGVAAQKDPPTIVELDRHFREVGVSLAAQACERAMEEWGGSPADVTHTVAVTCTSTGNPGYDLLVNLKLGLRDPDRTLLHGVGCAGSLSIMRAAAQIAAGATARRKPARILAYACELCTPLIRCELAAAEKSSAADVGIAGALFSDGAAAFVLCNELGLNCMTFPLFELVQWGSALIPNTIEDMSFLAEPYGYRTVLSRRVAKYTSQAIGSMFEKLIPAFAEHCGLESMTMADFDWALHPGGKAILDKAGTLLGLTENQLRASLEIYRTRGNSASPTVLMVLDRLRRMGEGREHVVATSFGPGLTIEMALLKRCRSLKQPVIVVERDAPVVVIRV